MYNAPRPNDSDLPSNKQLFISTAMAMLVAAVLLVSVILPAEYGIDATGIGKALGLTQMGEIKMQLAQEAEQEASAEPIKKETETVAARVEEKIGATMRSEQTSVTLASGAAAEVKVAMNKGQSVTYSWQVDTGHVNFDVHGDNPSTDYFNYTKGKAVTQDAGTLTAAFDGRHGWFWRNRSQQTVTVTLKVEGEFSDIKRVM